MDVTLDAYGGVDGARIARLPFSSLTWSDSISEQGSLEAEVPGGERFLGGALRPYGTIVAARAGARVLHAGYVTKATLDRATGAVSVSAGGGGTILEKRLVLNRALKTSWRDGPVIIDEDNPPGDWVLALEGSYRDIARGLVEEALAWGGLPIDLPPVEGGAHERNYRCWDLATVLERLDDLAALDDGPEIRFDPSVSDGRISFLLRVGDEIVDRVWRWNPAVPGQGVYLGTTDLDGEPMCTQCFGTGGREEDELLVARSAGGALEEAGWPVLQVANTEHSTVSDLATLRSYVAADVAAGDDAQECTSLGAPASLPVRPGDWAEIRGVGPCKVTDVSGDASTGRITVSVRRRV